MTERLPVGKILLGQPGFDPWVGKIPGLGRSLDWEVLLEKGMAIHLPGEFNGQRSLAGYSLWDHKELDTTEGLTLSLSHSHFFTR